MTAEKILAVEKDQNLMLLRAPGGCNLVFFVNTLPVDISNPSTRLCELQFNKLVECFIPRPISFSYTCFLLYGECLMRQTRCLSDVK